LWTHSLAYVIDSFQYIVDESALLEGYQVQEDALIEFLNQSHERQVSEIDVAELMGFLFKEYDDDGVTWNFLNWEQIVTEYVKELAAFSSIQISVEETDWDNRRFTLKIDDGDETINCSLILGQVSPGEKVPTIVYRSKYISEQEGYYSWLDILFVDETRSRFINHIKDKLFEVMKNDYIEILNGSALTNIELTKIDNAIQKYFSLMGFNFSTDRQQMRKLVPLYELPESTSLYWNQEFTVAVFTDTFRVRALLFNKTGQMTRSESIVSHLLDIQSTLRENLKVFLRIKGLTDSNIFSKDKIASWIPAVIVIVSSVLGVLFKVFHWESAYLSVVTTTVVVVSNLITLIGVFVFGIIPYFRLALFSWNIDKKQSVHI
jgi:hypothetical protein